MATDQTTVAPPSDVVNSEQLRSVVSKLVEQEIRKLHASQEKGSLLGQFAGEVAVTGLSDSIKAKNKCVKFAWMLIFLGGLGATAFFVYKVFEEYQKEPTATKISTLQMSTYEFPRVAVCFDTWLNTEKAMSLGLSKEGLKYALRFLMPFEDVATQALKKSKNVSGVEQEFLKVYQDHNYTSLVDFFKDIATDAVLNSKNEKEIGFQCTGCHYTDRLQKVIIDKTVCYLLQLKEVDGKLRQAYGLPEFELRVPDLSKGILDRRAYWKLYVNPMKVQLMADTPYISIYERHAHSVRFLSEKYVTQASDYCISEDDPEHPNYTALSCVVGCAATYYRIVHGCSVFNLDWNHSRPVEEYCNTYTWKRWPITENVDLNRTQSLMYGCINQCKDECSSTWYSTSIDAHYSNSLVKDAAAWNNRNETAIPMRSAKVYFINLDALAGGVLTFTEVSTYSFQTLVGNIGGTCGIWIGVSVMTLIQLFMFFVEQALDCCDNAKAKEKEKAKKEKEKTKGMELNGKEQTEQTALV